MLLTYAEMNPEPETDDKLAMDLKERSSDAFGKLYHRHKNSLFDYCYRMLKDEERAKDAVQEAFIVAWKDIATLNHTQSFRSWIFSIARYTSLNLIRSGKRIEKLTDEPAVDDPDPLEILIATDRAADLNGILEQMRPEFKELIVLRDLEGLSYAEIAGITGLSVSSVRIHLFRARKVLAKLYSQRHGEGK